MCGISFLLDKIGTCNDIPITKMVDAQFHRGPDAKHFYSHSFTKSSQIFLGASRLRITENSEEADQPFFNAERTCAIVFNGEIYNFFDLKNELLKQQIQFITNSDTEVLLHWIRIFGESRIDELEGMFSFVYCDFVSNKIIIARDRFGMKPLYYFQDEKFLIIASETRGIIASGLVKKELNERQVAHYFNYKYAKPPETFYRDVFQLQPGQYIIVDDEKVSEPVSFYTPEYSLEQTSVQDFKQELIDSIYQHIYSKRGVGLLFSGGIDSSLLLSLAVQEGIKLPCYSIFSHSNTEEKKNAQFLAKKLLVDHRVLEIDESILDGFDEYVTKLDQPISDSAGLLTWHISEYASKDVKVLLSGAGADELFAGYNRHRAYNFYLKNKSNSLLFKKYGYPVVGKILPQNLKHYFYGIDESEQVTMSNFIKAHFSFLSGEFKDDHISKLPTSDKLKNLLIEDLTNYLPNDVLAISDRMSMSVGMEMRMPFLTNSILEMVNGLSSQFLMKNGPKWILKEMLSDVVTKDYLKQQKAGFGLPLDKWLTNEKSNHLWRLLDNQNSYIFNFLEPGIFKQLLSRHKEGKGNHAQELWSLVTLGYWLQNEFEE